MTLFTFGHAVHWNLFNVWHETIAIKIKYEKNFNETQTAEIEQERDEYESKIQQLTDTIDKRMNSIAENEDSAINKVKIKKIIYF